MSHFTLWILPFPKYKYSPVKILLAYFETSHSIVLNKRILNFLCLLNTLTCIYIFYICIYLYVIYAHILYVCILYIFWGIFLKLIFWDNCFRGIMCGLAHLLHYCSSPLFSVFVCFKTNFSFIILFLSLCIL